MKMKQTLIIGAGHAGQNLHLKTLKKLEINTLVGFVDNNIIKSIPGINRKNIFKNLSSVDFLLIQQWCTFVLHHNLIKKL